MHGCAQCKESFKKVPNSVIHTSHNHNDEFFLFIAEKSVMNFFLIIITIRWNYSESYSLQNWARNLIWIIINFIKKLSTLVHWLILMAPSCLQSHNARYIMLKSLNMYQHYHSQKTPHISPSWASYVVSIVRIWEKIDFIMVASVS